MKHKVVIKLKNGRVEHIMASGDTDVAIIEEHATVSAKTMSFAKMEPDFIFEIGKAFEAYMGKARKWLEKEKF